MSSGRALRTGTLGATFGARNDRRTRMTGRERMASATILATMKAMGMDAGWSRNPARLHAELQATAV
jgi:hypothetical protein